MSDFCKILTVNFRPTQTTKRQSTNGLRGDVVWHAEYQLEDLAAIIIFNICFVNYNSYLIHGSNLSDGIVLFMI